jgi:hypothetical protein
VTDSLISRRDFLKLAGIAGGAIGLSACAPAVVAPTPTMEGMGSTSGGTTADEMDAMHEAGVKTFLDNIGKDEAFWGTRLRPRDEDGFKVFELNVRRSSGKPSLAKLWLPWLTTALCLVQRSVSKKATRFAS